MAKITNRGVTSYSVSSVFQGGVSVVFKSVTGTVKLAADAVLGGQCLSP